MFPMTNTSPLHTLAVETDTKLADLHGKRRSIVRTMDQHADTVRRAAGQKYSRNSEAWSGTWQEALDAVAAIHPPTYYSIQAKDAIEVRNALAIDLAVLDDQIDALNDVYRQHLWSRFFLVLNNNGHIHSSMSCTTCFITTEFGWLPQLSGLSEADAVADQGEILCSVCYPSAPVAWTMGESKASIEAKAERAAAKAERDAAKRAKAIREDGEPIYVVTSWYDAQHGNRGDRIETIAAAKSALTDVFESWRQVDDVVRNARQVLAEAIAARTGKTPDEEMAEAAKRAAKRR